jgi:D-alanine--poly(phosphoribitol) ligase subunit 2
MSDVATLRQQLVALFAEDLKVDIRSVDTDLFETGVLDSLAFVELLLRLEQEFDVKSSMEDMDVENFRSIARIADFVLARTAPRPPAGAPAVAVPLWTAS